MTYKELVHETLTQQFMEDKITVDQYTTLTENIDVIAEVSGSVLKNAGKQLGKLNFIKNMRVNVIKQLKKARATGIGSGKGMFKTAAEKKAAIESLLTKHNRLVMASKAALPVGAGAAGVAAGAAGMKASENR